MRRTFENPPNGFRTSVGAADSVLVFLFGGLYLLIRGLWVHAIIWWTVALFPSLISGTPIGFLLAGVLSIGYAFAVQSLVAKKYLNAGWREITAETISAEAPISTLAAPVSSADPLLKKCPYCAEEVRAEAIKCKHCGSALRPA